MKMKRILCLVMALVLCGALALAEDTDLQAQLDAANERIAELESQIEAYKPYYDAQIVAEFDGGVIFRDDALAVYQQYEDLFSQSYGINLADYGMDGQYKQYAVQTLVREAVVEQKAKEMGLDVIDDATMAGLTEQAASNFETYITSVSSYFTGDDVTEEETRAKAIEYLESVGYTQDGILENMIKNQIDEQVYNELTKDVTVTDEDVQAAYDELVATQESSFASDSAYNSSRNNGELIVYNPENYRAVKHVLIKFSDDQATRYSELNSTLTSLNAELESVQNPTEAPETEDAEEAEVRAPEAIQADINATHAELDALYEELMPTAQEVIDKFNAGTAFADLIAEYNEDPGMENEPTATNGYAVSANSTTWDPAFTEGAMSIESVGGISEPVRGQNGIHIILYESDIPAGAVALEEVREQIESSALDTKITDTYNSVLDDWMAAVNPIYYYDNL